MEWGVVKMRAPTGVGLSTRSEGAQVGAANVTAKTGYRP